MNTTNAIRNEPPERTTALQRLLPLALWLLWMPLVLPAATFTVTTTNDSGSGSLRRALTDANSNSDFDVVTFNLAPGQQTIRPLSALPTITGPVLIDGFSQPGYGGSPVIELDGSLAGSTFGLGLATSNCTVRGLVINRFQNSGIRLNGGGNHVFEGNYLGTDVTGRLPGFGNGERGFNITGSRNNRIGGLEPGQFNLISGNTLAGIELIGGASDNRIEGNVIGLDATRTGSLPNGERGIYISDTATVRNTIGGLSPSAGNVIACNTHSGIVVKNGATQNAILGNSIYGNTGLGINLVGDQVTVNDPLDADSGDNLLQNFPVLTSALVIGSRLHLQGTLQSSSDTSFRLEFFASTTCDASGYGEGQFFLGAMNVTAGADGNASFSIALPLPSGEFHFVTATATDPANNTSEFSRSVLVGGEGCAIESTFDDATHGWRVWLNNNTFRTGTWTPSGGNPSGYFSQSEGGADGNFAYWQAPAQFLGNQAVAYGGYLDFDLKQSLTDSQDDASDVVLIGNGLQLVLDTTVNPLTNWTPYRVFLHEAAGWRVGSPTGPVATEAQLRLVLGSLQFLRIRAEYRSGGDVDGLDNVRLVLGTPSLTMRKLGNALCVEWPVAASCFQLESTETLSPPAWTPVVAGIETTNGVNRVITISQDGMRFYRLTK